MTVVPAVRTFSLDDRYAPEARTSYLTGIQALVRVLLDQARSDRRRGLTTGGLVCGYPGSPVAGVDMELFRRAALLAQHGIVHRPGLNEDLAATAVFGTQLLHEFPSAGYDGVFGMWFGKAPGVDRSVDAFRHANFKGIGRNGGVLVVAGDDPGASSSILPSDSTHLFADLAMPVLYPAGVQDIVDLGLHGYRLSRECGLGVGFKFVTAVAESAATVDVSPDRMEWREARPPAEQLSFQRAVSVNQGGPAYIEQERRMRSESLDAAVRYARLNGLNPVFGDGRQAALGIIASGKTYVDVLEAMRSLGLDPERPGERGIRLMKLGMLWPIDREAIREFASGVDEILVIEEKAAFVELLVKDALYGVTSAAPVVGKRDEHDAALLPGHGEVSPLAIAVAMARRLPGHGDLKERADRLQRPSRARIPVAAAPAAARTMYFCSGCPHNRSLAVPEGSVVGAGIGCHIMETGLSVKQFGEVLGFTHMGGEGAQWVGVAPFTATDHIFQNLGDGTFSHSGTLAVRFAVSSGVNITYKILYNDAVAMTGGQNVTGGFSVPQLTRLLEAEGVKRIFVTTEDPGRYRGVKLPPIAEVRHRDRLLGAQEELASIPGVTVLIHDQRCAAEARRLRKRGQLATPKQSVMINQRVCEGCGDCGDQSNCLSVQPVDTEFGKKTAIHQSSCNKDFSCLLGDCPSFVSVVPKAARPDRRASRALSPPDIALAEPETVVPLESVALHLTGIGGTGVVTVNQILATAAAIDGRSVIAHDNLGGSQKAGPVVSSLRISLDPQLRSSAIGPGGADAMIVFDLLVGADPANLAKASAERTVAVVNVASVPTGAMIGSSGVAFPAVDGLVRAIDDGTRSDRNVHLDAQAIAETLLGDSVATNMVTVGAAFQAGALPLSEEAIRQAVRINGQAVQMNLDAFTWGRLSVARPDVVAGVMAPAPARPEPAGVADGPPWAEGELGRVLGVRRRDLGLYQDAAYAQSYVETIRRVFDAEGEKAPGRTALTMAAAKGLYQLMAYKDEYEVARLSLDQAEQARIRNHFGDGAKVSYHLLPPMLRSLGRREKVVLGPWFRHVYRVLRAMRRVRGTRLDVFGRAHVRQVERALVVQYQQVLEAICGSLTVESHSGSVALAGLVQMVRGFEGVKLRNVERYEHELNTSAADLGFGPFASVL